MDSLLDRHLLSLARQYLDVFPTLIIEGARQVGKSTFASMLVADRSAMVVSLDDLQNRRQAADDPVGFVGQLPNGTLVIDEIQRVPELILPIKAAIDANRRPGRFVLTGSSDLLRLQRTPDSLAGRAVTLRLRGFSQGELRGVREDFIGWLTGAMADEPAKGIPLPADGVSPRFPWSATSSMTRENCVSMLSAGGYPAMALGEKGVRNAWLTSYIQQVVQQDTADVRRVTEPLRLTKLLRLLAANQAGELIKARLANEADIPASTITDYLNVLTTLFLVDSIPPWTPNLTGREIDRPKAVVVDPAMALSLARVKPASLIPVSGEYLGHLLEGFVAEELAKQRSWSSVDYDIYHYRSAGGTEVDLVLELEDGLLLGIEVKTTQSVLSAHVKNLRRLRSQ
ncbi:MAG: ATP-binding protein, partial [Propionibacteriaceae bacterium]|nr:ATP-binding protein [Propionibacteriaceae bacterium]